MQTVASRRATYQHTCGMMADDRSSVCYCSAKVEGQKQAGTQNQKPRRWVSVFMEHVRHRAPVLTQQFLPTTKHCNNFRQQQITSATHRSTVATRRTLHLSHARRIIIMNNNTTGVSGWELPAIPLAICTDSYKTSHFLQYPPGCQRMVAVRIDAHR